MKNLILIYILNFVLSIIFTTIIMRTIEISGWEMLLFCFIFVNLIYFVSLKTNNTSYIDLFWSMQGLFMIFVFIFKFNVQYPWKFKEISSQWESFLPIILVSLYSFRHLYIYFRNFKVLKEDFRYVNFKKKYPNPITYQLFNYFSLHLVANSIEFFGHYPAFDLINTIWGKLVENGENYYLYSNFFFKFLFYYGVFISYLGIILETVADEQLHEFKENREKNQLKLGNKIMRTGLWSFSRHPNYLGELLFYSGLFISNISINPISIFNSLGIILIYCLFLLFSVNVMDEYLLNKYGEEYQYYMNNVSAIFPFINKEKRKN